MTKMKPNKKQQLAQHKFKGMCKKYAYVEDATDDESSPTESVSKGEMDMEMEKPYKCKVCGERYKGLSGLTYHEQHSAPCQPHHSRNSTKSKKTQSKAIASRAASSSDSEDQEYTEIALRPKPRPKARNQPFIPDPQRVLDAFHEASTTLETLGVYLNQIAKAQDIVQWMEENVADKLDTKKLLQMLNTVAGHLHPKNELLSTSSSDRSPSILAAMNQYFVLRGASKSVSLLAPMETFITLPAYKPGKVLGFVRLKGDQYPEMCALPGWVPCAKPHPRLLDSPEWTKRVLKFAETYGHSFTRGNYDDHHRVPRGTTYACHVEPKLMLYLACRKLQVLNGDGKEPHLGHLFKLNRLPSIIEADVVISKKPCKDCKRFQAMLEELIGRIKFSIIVSSNLEELIPKLNQNGERYNGTFASDVSESDSESDPEEAIQLQKPEKRLSNIEVQIPSRAIQVIKTVTTNTQKKRTTIQTSEYQTPKRHHTNTSSPPSRGTRSQLIVPEMLPLPPKRKSPTKAVTSQKKQCTTGPYAPPRDRRRQFNEHDLSALVDLEDDELEIVGEVSMTPLGGKKTKFVN